MFNTAKRAVGISRCAIAVLALMVAISEQVMSQNTAAEQAFCAYTMNQAIAQRDLLRTPALTAGPIQPSTGTPAQLVIGFSSSVADSRKASLVVKLAHSTCELYTSSSEAQMHIFYALPTIQKEALTNRIQVINETLKTLDVLIADNMKRVNSGNLTLPSVYGLQSAKIRLDSELTSALMSSTALQVPTMTDVPLRELVAQKLNDENENQKRQAKLLKQNSWDVQLSVGMREQLSGGSAIAGSRVGPYATVNFTYNLSARSMTRHLDNAVGNYNDWKRTQWDDVAFESALLKKQVSESIAIQTAQLKVLLQQEAEIDGGLSALEGVDTTNAITFRNNLLADQLLLKVETNDTKVRLTLLQKFLTSNF